MHQFSFPKKEHLTSKLDIEALFTSKNRALKSFPLRVVYKEVEEAPCSIMVLISVSKRHFKHAVDRNRAKRQIREAYRLHKHILLEPLLNLGKKVHVAFIWTSDRPIESPVITASMKKLLLEIAESYPQNL